LPLARETMRERASLPLALQAESASIPAITPKNNVHTPKATRLHVKGVFELELKNTTTVVIAWRNEFHMIDGAAAKGLPGFTSPGARTRLLWEA
jgi:hypothetical protein